MDTAILSFPGATSAELLDRMLELMLYLEKHLR